LLKKKSSHSRALRSRRSRRCGSRSGGALRRLLRADFFTKIERKKNAKRRYCKTAREKKFVSNKARKF